MYMDHVSAPKYSEPRCPALTGLFNKSYGIWHTPRALSGNINEHNYINNQCGASPWLSAAARHLLACPWRAQSPG